MRNCLLFVSTANLLLALTSVAWCADEGNESSKEELKPFDVLMVTGRRAGKFHCPATEFGLNPGVLIFTRAEPDALGKPLTDFLKALDEQIGKYPFARLGTSVIFLGDGGYQEALLAKSDKNDK